MKRFFDLLLSIILLAVLAPVMAFLTFATYFALGRPIFFLQKRPGLHEKLFKLIKFRTMSAEVGPDGEPLADAKRLTAFGRFMRATSLDELPELWNVLIGDMSLVGPRPLLVQYLDYYSDEQARRHEVRPGVTGWAQVNGRNALSWEEKFRLDVWYVDHRSFWLDMKILLLTFGQVLRATGINQPGNATMEEFKGTIE